MIRIEDSVIYQDVIENGIKQGIEKGIKKGKSQGKIEILMRQLKRKFKTFPAIWGKTLRSKRRNYKQDSKRYFWYC